MDIHIGNVEGLAAFKEALYYNRDLRIPLPPDGWMGAEAAVNTEPPDATLQDAGFKKEMKFRNTAVIVATEMNFNFNRTVTRMNAPWHLREGLRQSGVELTEAQFARLESLMKDSLSPTSYLEGITGGITNLAASRVAALWDFNAPAFVVSAKEGSVAQAIEIASFLLDLGKTGRCLCLFRF